MELKRVVVTGLGAITPLGNDVETAWTNAINGVSGAGPITHFDASLFKTQFACEVKNFNVDEYLDRRDARRMDLYCHYAMASATQALADSKLLDDEKVDRNEIGVIYGSGIGGLHTFENEAGYYAKNEDKGPKYNPFFIPMMIADIAAGHISIKWGLRGPNYGIVSACATSTNALIDAFNYVRLGKATAIVTGGSEAAIFPAGVGGFNSMKAISTRNDDPATASRPFSGSRDGFVETLVFNTALLRRRLCRGDWWRHERRRLSHHRQPPRGTGSIAGDEARSGRCRHHRTGCGLHQRARHLHPSWRPERGTGHY